MASNLESNNLGKVALFLITLTNKQVAVSCSSGQTQQHLRSAPGKSHQFLVRISNVKYHHRLLRGSEDGNTTNLQPTHSDSGSNGGSHSSTVTPSRVPHLPIDSYADVASFIPGRVSISERQHQLQQSRVLTTTTEGSDIKCSRTQRPSASVTTEGIPV
ncbi:hypothetical protein J6590_087711 [Homalodisca vitripennis]|nr:hypothetical protein J6590_087711 [Homalodisca vitripennis]